MADKSWKVLERKIAKDIHGKRVLNKGKSAPDVTKDENIIVEAKYRKNFSLKKSLEQVEGYRKSKNQILVVIRREPGKKNLEVYMKYSDLRKLVRRSLRSKDFIVQLNYEDFVNMAVLIGKEDEN